MNRFRSDGFLLLAALIWGTGFVAQRMGMDHVGPLGFTAARFTIGAGVVGALVLLMGRGGARDTERGWRACLGPGVVAGVVLFAGAMFQQVGLVSTTAGKAGFITGLYVVMVPLLGLALGHRAPWATWLGVGAALIGLYLLSVTEGLRLERGDALVLCGAVVWAMHTLVLAWVAPRTGGGSDLLRVATVQFATAAALAWVGMPVFEPLDLGGMWRGAGAIAYSGVLSVGVAFTLQVVAQRDAPPAHAAVLLSMEAVFAALSGVIMLDERLTSRELVGCGLMLAGMLISQVRGRGEHDL